MPKISVVTDCCVAKYLVDLKIQLKCTYLCDCYAEHVTV